MRQAEAAAVSAVSEVPWEGAATLLTVTASLILQRMMHDARCAVTICVCLPPAPSPTWRWGYAGGVKGVLMLTRSGLAPLITPKSAGDSFC